MTRRSFLALGALGLVDVSTLVAIANPLHRKRLRLLGRAGVVMAYQRIVFDSGTSQSYEQTWAVPVDLSAPIQETFRTADTTQDITPVVSPDGSKIAYISGTGFGNYKLRVVDADATNDIQLDAGPGCAFPVWRPDGQKILYRKSGGFRTINPDGTGGAAITISPAPTAGFTLNGAQYNYDGTLIAFGVDDNLSGVDNTLWVMNADGSGASSVSGTTRTGPLVLSWSPVDNRIAFVKRISSSQNDLRVIDPAGTLLATVKSSIVGGIMRQAWSSDGTKIAHTHNSPSTSSIWVSNADGSGGAALSPTLRLLASGITGPLVAGDRIWVVRNTTADLVSVALDGSDLIVHDTPNLVGPVFVDLRLADNGGTGV